MVSSILAANIIVLYILIGIITGYNVAYRVIKLRKQSKKEFFLAIATLPISSIVWALTMISLLTFHRKRKLERMTK